MNRMPGRHPGHEPRPDYDPCPDYDPRPDRERAGAGDRPLYGRTLRLQHVNPGGALCFLFFEGAIALGALMALAELVPWWGVPVLPLTVAVLVKVNDVLAGALAAGEETAPAGRDDRPGPVRPGVATRAEHRGAGSGYRVNRQRLAGAAPAEWAQRRSRQSTGGRYE